MGPNGLMGPTGRSWLWEEYVPPSLGEPPYEMVNVVPA